MGDNGMKRTDRGQTQLDFAAGVTIFIAATVIVLALFPVYLLPFQENHDHAKVDRVAESFISQVNHDDYSDSTLDLHCTSAYFAQFKSDVTNKDTSTCRFNSFSTPQQAAGVSSNTGINITVQEIGTSTPITRNGVEFSVGDNPQASDVYTSQRIARLTDDTNVKVIVYVW